MTDSALLPAAVRIAFERIVDYAGLFPPAQLGMAEAAAEYERARSGREGWMLGRFILPVARTTELESALEGGTRVPLAVLLDGETAIASTPRTQPESCEIPLSIENEVGAARAAIRTVHTGLAALAANLPVAIEIPSNLNAAVLAEAMDTLAERGLSAKLRCGGVSAQAVPEVESVAAFVRAAVHAGVAFKVTAGLHHPVRRYNEAAGFVMHGFLNVLAASCFARDCDAATLVRVIEEEDATAFTFNSRGFAWRGLVAIEDVLREARTRRMLSFGSCSFAEPVDGLVALGILRT